MTSVIGFLFYTETVKLREKQSLTAERDSKLCPEGKKGREQKSPDIAHADKADRADYIPNRGQCPIFQVSEERSRII